MQCLLHYSKDDVQCAHKEYSSLSLQGLLCNVDVNECAHFAGTDLGCQNGATCINKLGTYE